MKQHHTHFETAHIIFLVHNPLLMQYNITILILRCENEENSV